MLREDTNGDFVGCFAFEGRNYEYRVRGYGRPVLITASISPRYGSYAWRYIFECLAGTRFVYSLDVEGMIRVGENTGPEHHAKLIEAFLREIIGVRSTIIAGEREYTDATSAALEARSLVDKVIFLCPGGAEGFRLRGPVVAGKGTGTAAVPALDRLRQTTAGSRICTVLRSGNSPLPGGKSPLRICEDLMKLLR
ncbi:hypothetical protein [Methanocella sp. MCL-LM]|uniref:hypothetical protein n=1 Tax=Methanocella sp. MCL-LM TaxID=3412035 RepID=UPI003C76FFF9